ncbi:MAG: MarR family transcriptional regulator [Pseudomonadota bacterium]
MTVALRPSQALSLWRNILSGLVQNGESDFTVRQLTILTTIYLDPPPHTVRGLAAKLGVSKPVITRALDSLGQKNLVSRRRDPADRRNVIIQRTVEGSLYLEALGDRIINEAEVVTS